MEKKQTATEQATATVRAWLETDEYDYDVRITARPAERTVNGRVLPKEVTW